MIEFALLSTEPKCLPDLCLTVNDNIGCSYTVSSGTVLVLLMETGYGATDVLK